MPTSFIASTAAGLTPQVPQQRGAAALASAVPVRESGDPALTQA
ncbi:hypothetical protein [Embleya sp. NPDC050493]